MIQRKRVQKANHRYRYRNFVAGVLSGAAQISHDDEAVPEPATVVPLGPGDRGFGDGQKGIGTANIGR